MLGQLRERAMRRTGWAIVAGLALEMVIIVGQAARGEMSHFNTDGGLGSVLFSIMGATITVVWFLTLAIALRFLREPGRDRAMTLAIRLGLLVSLVGMAVGFLLARQRRPRRRRARRRPRPVLRRLEHDGRRPAHRPLRRPARPPGAAAAGGAPRAPPDVNARGSCGRSVGYLGVVLLLIWQALRAQPLFAPDAYARRARRGRLAALAVLPLPGRR